MVAVIMAVAGLGRRDIAPPTTRELGRRHKRTVLIIDDERRFRSLVFRLLHGLSPNLRVEKAENGLNAQRQIRRFRPDLVVINVVFGNLIEPHMLGRRLGLSTLVVILSLIFWAWAWGPVGALLAVPLTMVVKIMLENTQDLRWVAVLLDKSAPEPAITTPAPVDFDEPTG